jgi:sterol desaturase/sphingolipid hydroxylase (fatty acid hydroxylase superfamily)
MQPFIQAASVTFVTLLLAGVVFGLLAAVVKRGQLTAGLARARPEIITNLSLLFFNALLVVPLLATPLESWRNSLPRLGELAKFWEAMPAPLTLLAAIVIFDLAGYWRHRWEHSRTLWPIHATHHADEAMNWLTLRRKHPLGEVFSMTLDLIPVLMLGLPVWAIALAALFRSVWGYFIHADVPWTLGWFGKVLISPAAHRLHHIRDEKLMGSNYGNTIALWDQVFGTYVDPTPYVNCETGIAEGTRDFVGELARPFEKRYRRGQGTVVAAEQGAA